MPRATVTPVTRSAIEIDYTALGLRLLMLRQMKGLDAPAAAQAIGDKG